MHDHCYVCHMVQLQMYLKTQKSTTQLMAYDITKVKYTSQTLIL